MTSEEVIQQAVGSLGGMRDGFLWLQEEHLEWEWVAENFLFQDPQMTSWSVSKRTQFTDSPLPSGFPNKAWRLMLSTQYSPLFFCGILTNKPVRVMKKVTGDVFLLENCTNKWMAPM